VSELSGFCVFLKDDSTDLREIFSGLRRKHLIITTHVEKQCTRALNIIRSLFRYIATKPLKCALKMNHFSFFQHVNMNGAAAGI